MLKKSVYTLFLVLMSAALFRCAEPEASPSEVSQKFTAIFDDSRFNASYVPLDIKQTQDGGYIVLSAQRRDTSDFSCIHLLKADKQGNFVAELPVGQSLFNALPNLTLINNKFHFVAMRKNSVAAIASIDQDLSALDITDVEGLTYPAAATYEDNSFLMLSYNSEALESVISRVTLAGAVSASKGFSIGVDESLEDPIINHFFFNGRKFPFAVGKISGGTYYFNGFYDYTFSMVITNMNDDEPLGVIAGQHENGGFSALAPLGGSTFATARFHFGENFLMPRTPLTLQGNSMGSELKDHPLPELMPNAKIKIIRATINGKNVVIYGSDTRSKQIGLYFYDEATGNFLGSRYLGFSNPYEFSSAVSTTDGGLAVCGTTYLAGRFPRICIFKLSLEDMAEDVPAD
jgi:hypothetical protein